MTPAVTIEGPRLAVRFGPSFDLDSYEMFLRVKALPERDVAYDWRADAYTVTAPARFAARLGAEVAALERVPMPLAGHLFDYQRFIVERALDAKRYAIWADTGLGKTAMFLEWARQVVEITDARVLIVSPLQIIEQTRAEWERFYGGWPLHRIESREDLSAWCSNTTGPNEIGIVNPEKFIPGTLSELRLLGGLVLDESSLLKTGGGTIKWNLIHSARGIEYKLSCTATPAPNDTMEYASQAAFLEKLRSEGDILWTFFSRDKYGIWRVKPHAREAFYRFMASWSIYLRDPAHYGFGDILATLPPPEIREHRIGLMHEQRTRMIELQVESGKGMFNDRLGVRERAKLSQLAKGFVYGPGKTVERVPSNKPGYVAGLVREHLVAKRPTIVWTVFDEESAIVADEIADLCPWATLASLHGSDKPEARQVTIDAFKAGSVDVLVTKALLVGHGLNLQNCRAMVFSGFDDSFERLYQAIRRAYRFGQTDTVHVDMPVVPELEGLIFDNVMAKEAAFMRDVEVQERNYRAALAAEGLTEITPPETDA